MTIITRRIGKKLKQKKKGRQPTKPKMSSTDDGNDSLSMLQHNMDDIVFSSDEEEDRHGYNLGHKILKLEPSSRS